MTLAGMIATDRDAVICDMAETYGVFDLYAVPVPLLATLASGLRDDSRIKLKMAGLTGLPITAMIARAADDIALLLYSFTQDAEDGKNMPHLFTEMMTGGTAPVEKETKGFESGAAFDQAWKQAITNAKE